jgi:hypothetical protein
MAVLLLSALPDEPILPAVLFVRETPDEVAAMTNSGARHVLVTLLSDGDAWWVRADAITVIQPDPPPKS